MKGERELKNRTKEIERRKKRCEKCEQNIDGTCYVSNWPSILMIKCQKKDGEQE